MQAQQTTTGQGELDQYEPRVIPVHASSISLDDDLITDETSVVIGENRGKEIIARAKDNEWSLNCMERAFILILPGWKCKSL